jgi:hypothetical protein
MRRTACLAVLCLAALPASAADDAASLDLSLPQAASPHRNDPPGTWYGDTSGVPAGAADISTIVRRACPTAPDGSATDLTGSVRAGIGYSSHGGNSNWQSASLNYCKTHADEDGDEHTVNMQLHVDQYDGPGPDPGWGPYPGPRPGPWGGAPRR